MNIQTTKLELMQLLLATDREEVLEKVKKVFEDEETDFWDSLPVEDQVAIEEGIAELDQGKYVLRDAVKEVIKERFNF